MKTDLEGISKAYRDSSRNKAPESGAACPTPERLARCVLGEARRKERAEIIRHAADCAACAAAMKSLLALSAGADEAAAELAARPGKTETGRSGNKWAFWTRPIPKPAAVVMAAVLVVAALAVWLPRFTNRSAVRGGNGTRIVLVSPVKTAAAGDALEFEWRGVAAADSYTVELFDKSFRSLWRSGRVTGNAIRLPADVRGRLTPGETYFWTVRTAASGGTEIKSSLAEFSLAR
jgi:hypothetical protein